MSGTCSVCGRPLRVSTGVGPKCARKIGGTQPPAIRSTQAAPPVEVHPDQTSIPIQPTLPKEN
ncbi:hypothetical protein ACRJ4W_15350 [Streptomyces sp. GLT-R25]